MNQQEERNCVAVSCSSCFLKLSMLQKQTEKIENMLFCIKKTLNFKEACLYMGPVEKPVVQTCQERAYPPLQTVR